MAGVGLQKEREDGGVERHRARVAAVELRAAEAVMPRAHARDSEGPCSKRMWPPEMPQYSTFAKDCKLAALGRLTIESAMPASSPFSSSICPGRWRAGAPRSVVGRVFRFFARGKRSLVGTDVSSVLMKREALGPRGAAAAQRRLKRLSDRHRALCPALLSKIH